MSEKQLQSATFAFAELSLSLSRSLKIGTEKELVRFNGQKEIGLLGEASCGLRCPVSPRPAEEQVDFRRMGQSNGLSTRTGSRRAGLQQMNGHFCWRVSEAKEDLLDRQVYKAAFFGS
ncbi:unnamed protein product [Protopolystoma xenopodis]|uniref:Uncharacterized protein n=1 Tax=Protopolystoma xenopodis TaxID=117903 RepID=A0A3S5CR16_9PLAT|nr:unnamed protein product [Protopolystoma xenopodis]